ncbi:hypothetical protein FA13DRAFT_1796555 [Coprinellus micaceus]|uniref:Uncharacterized protein n=1 Tax=Coprinellus micaceus TaxID=71717 RepID=A0A4Y7STZ5_COPMI|nr:hypothetical protein FA13DRAFT_1796555 [Coprinellus micaceus]
MPGRPRLYHTPEEQAEARKRTANAWYERNKKTVNKGKRKARKRAGAIPRAKKQPRVTTGGASIAQEGLPVTAKDKTLTNQQDEGLDFSVRQVGGIPRRFRKALMGSSPSEYFNMVCRHTIQCLRDHTHFDKAVEAIHEFSLPFSKLKLALEKYQGFILQLGAHTSEYVKAKEMWTDLHLMGGHFEDIECRAMVGELEDDFLAGQLDFQKGFTLASL